MPALIFLLHNVFLLFVFITNKRNSFYLQLFLLCSRTHFYWNHYFHSLESFQCLLFIILIFLFKLKKFSERKSQDIFIFSVEVDFVAWFLLIFSMLVTLIFYVFNIVFHYKENPLFISYVCVCFFFSTLIFHFA